MPSYIREQGAALARLGYSVVPVWSVLAETKTELSKEDRLAQYKAPVGFNWEEHPLTEEECENYYMPRCGVGIMCGVGQTPIVAVDCDIDGDDELSGTIRNKFNEILGFDSCPIRHGKRPKFLVVGRMDPNNRHSKMTSGKYSRDNGATSAQIEVLANGQQFVAYGIHPGTQKPYEWEPVEYVGDSISDFRPEDLPIFTVEKIRQCLAVFEREIAIRSEYKQTETGRESHSVAVGDDAWTNIHPEKPPVGIKPEYVKQMFQDLIDEEKIQLDNYQEWSRVGMALHHEFQGSGEGFAIWDELSSQADKYRGAEDLRTHWDSFGRYTGEVLTLKSYQAKWLDLDRYAFNESGLMNRVIRDRKRKLVYVDELNKFRDYYGPVWANASDSKARGYVIDTVEHSLAREAKKLEETGMEDKSIELLKFRSRTRLNLNRVCTNVMNDLKSKLRCSITDFDKDTNLFAVGNGVLKLATGEFVQATPEMMISRGSSVDFNAAARNERWEQFMLEVCDGDEETVDYLQRAVGYAMSGVPNQNLIFFLLGKGCNGKSVFLNTIAKVFGTYHKVVPPEYLTQSEKTFSASGKNADSVLISMSGARLCVSSETALGASLQEAVVKRLVSRDELTARALYSGEMCHITPTWVFFLGTNHFPDIRGTDKGIWRRIRVIDFVVDFDDDKHELDPYLEDKLAKNLSGVLNWCLEGYRKYLEVGIKPSKRAEEATKRVREQSDLIGQWLSERCQINKMKWVPLKEAFRNWCSWAAVNSATGKYPSDKIFGQVLTDYGFEKKRFNSGYKFLGFELLTDEEIAARKDAEAI